MTQLSDILDLDLLAQRRAERYVGQQVHPDNPDWAVLNYTNASQFDKVWDSVTTTCRGLIFNQATGKVLGRGLPKFFNYGELQTPPDGDFDVWEKLDGSAAIIYMAPDGLPAVATRGSFASDQAKWATAHLRSSPGLLAAAHRAIEAEHTLFAEIIYPENRIVVDYGGRRDLTHLTTVDIATGADVFLHHGWTGPVAQRFDFYDIDTMLSMDDDNAEGFVVRWRACGTRAKIKHPRYVYLHRLFTGMSEKTIWELLANHQTLEKMIELVPDEFYDWVRRTVASLEASFTEIEKGAFAVLAEVDRTQSRKDQAQYITARAAHPGIVFAMLDGKDYAPKIWQMIRPVGAKAFKNDLVDA